MTMVDQNVPPQPENTTYSHQDDIVQGIEKLDLHHEAASADSEGSCQESSDVDNIAQVQGEMEGSIDTALMQEEYTTYQMRALIDFKYVGAIIGRSGSSVKQIRQNTQCRVSIASQFQQMMVYGGRVKQPDCILSVTGVPVKIGEAFKQICERIVEYESKKSGGAEKKTLSANLLVPHQQTGAIIGKEGSNIKHIREKSGASLNVSRVNLFHSSDRTVRIVGTPMGIAIAVAELAQCLVDNPARGEHVPYTRDNYNTNYNNMYGGYNQNFQQGGINNGYDQRGPRNHTYTHDHQYNGAASVTVNIPEELVGAIIGKRGVRITRTRETSGVSKIRILDAQPGCKERQVYISGSVESVRYATQIIHSTVKELGLRKITRHNNNNGSTERVDDAGDEKF